MKYHIYYLIYYNYIVAPLVGAWIEILLLSNQSSPIFVAPLVGAWIEINIFCELVRLTWSLLSWERGLKLHLFILLYYKMCVAPLVGAWIEI